MLNDIQRAWLVDISELQLKDIFTRLRKHRLNSLDSSAANYDTGRQVQDEVAACHRIENLLVNLRKEATGPEKPPDIKKNK